VKDCVGWIRAGWSCGRWDGDQDVDLHEVGTQWWRGVWQENKPRKEVSG
jgi:phenolic acid decarboxylase